MGRGETTFTICVVEYQMYGHDASTAHIVLWLTERDVVRPNSVRHLRIYNVESNPDYSIR